MRKLVSIACTVFFVAGIGHAAERYDTGESRIDGGDKYGTSAGHSSFFEGGGKHSVYGVRSERASGVKLVGVREVDVQRLAGAAMSGNRRMLINRFRIMGGNGSISGFRPVRR